MAGHKTKTAATSQLVTLGLPPRVLELELAAAYVGLSASAFLDAVNVGHYPKPLSDGRRRQWDRHALDAAVDQRSNLTPQSKAQETADDIMGAIDVS